MKFPEWLPVYGDVSYRGVCPPESAEQVTFFNWIRSEFPDTYGRIALHPRNEGKRSYNQTARQKAEGMADGAPDIVIGSFMCELKRRDHTKSAWQKGQLPYLESAKGCGNYVCVALGWESAKEAFLEWKNTQSPAD